MSALASTPPTTNSARVVLDGGWRTPEHTGSDDPFAAVFAASLTSTSAFRGVETPRVGDLVEAALPGVRFLYRYTNDGDNYLLRDEDGNQARVLIVWNRARVRAETFVGQVGDRDLAELLRLVLQAWNGDSRPAGWMPSQVLAKQLAGDLGEEDSRGSVAAAGST